MTGVQTCALPIYDAANVREAVYLSRDGVVDASDLLLGQRNIDSLASGASLAGELAFTLPVSTEGAWRLIVVTDSNNANAESPAGEANNSDSLAIAVARDSFADLAVTAISAPSQVVADPASVTVGWTVTNLGSGAGRSLAWTDRVVYSTNDTLGDSDDIVLGNLVHAGPLASGESYQGSVTYRLAPGLSRHGKVFVQTDVLDQVWEHGGEANNTAQAAQPLDVMPIAYADLQIASVSTSASAASQATSGQRLTLSWTVLNAGIGATNTTQWTEIGRASCRERVYSSV